MEGLPLADQTGEGDSWPANVGGDPLGGQTTGARAGWSRGLQWQEGSAEGVPSSGLLCAQVGCVVCLLNAQHRKCLSSAQTRRQQPATPQKHQPPMHRKPAWLSRQQAETADNSQKGFAQPSKPGAVGGRVAGARAGVAGVVSSRRAAQAQQARKSSPLVALRGQARTGTGTHHPSRPLRKRPAGPAVRSVYGSENSCV